MAETRQPFDRRALELDVDAEIARLTEALRAAVFHTLHRQGGVVGISGGIDSSVVLALSARALGPERVIGVLLPEGESSPESVHLAHLVAERCGVHTVTEDITAALEGAGCYRWRDEAIRRLFPQFGPGWKSKIVLPGDLLERETLNVFSLTVTSPTGEEFTKRLPPREYYQIVAASNFKQRTRMAMLYYHAELRNYAVIGTANRNEHDQGFFVKHGDGGVDGVGADRLVQGQPMFRAEHHTGTGAALHRARDRLQRTIGGNVTIAGDDRARAGFQFMAQRLEVVRPLAQPRQRRGQHPVPGRAQPVEATVHELPAKPPAAAPGAKRAAALVAAPAPRILLIDRPNSPQSFIAAGQPLAVTGRRSICVMSPVTTTLDLNPILVRNILSWVRVVFCASSRITNESLSVRPRMKASGATSITPRSMKRSAFSKGTMSCSAS